MADALTKVVDATVLREFLRVGRDKLFDENEILKSRADARTRVKWLHETTPQEKPSRPKVNATLLANLSLDNADGKTL